MPTNTDSLQEGVRVPKSKKKVNGVETENTTAPEQQEPVPTVETAKIKEEPVDQPYVTMHQADVGLLLQRAIERYMRVMNMSAGTGKYFFPMMAREGKQVGYYLRYEGPNLVIGRRIENENIETNLGNDHVAFDVNELLHFLVNVM